MFIPQQWQSLAITSALLFSLPSTIAAPRRERHGPAKDERNTYSNLSNLQVPLSNGTMTLPGPTGKLKAITLGFGTQNYTCNATTPKPVLVGAKAIIFDLSPFLPWVSPFLAQIPGKALDLQVDKIASAIGKLGSHIFNDLGVPCFHLGDVGDMQAKKIPGADLVAPKDSSSGKDGVNWLKLGDKGGSKGINEVYRVHTAGGKPPATCEGQDDDITSLYAALYYFYE